MTNLEWAVRYRKAGWSIFPCRHKAPLTAALANYHGSWDKFKTQLPTEYQVEQWWTNYPDAQIALVCGRISHVTVVDFDWVKDETGKKREDLSIPVGELAAKLDITVSSFTGSNGIHKFFNYADIPTSLGTVHKQVDIKNDNSYVILPPSCYGEYKGKIAHYNWDDLFPWSEDNLKNLANIPQALYLQANKNKKEMKDWSRIVGGVSAGTRNESASFMAGKLLKAFNDPNLAFIQLEAWNAQNKPPLESVELESVFKSILKRDYASRPWIYRRNNQ
jgi:hypothetical protein